MFRSRRLPEYSFAPPDCRGGPRSPYQKDLDGIPLLSADMGLWYAHSRSLLKALSGMLAETPKASR